MSEPRLVKPDIQAKAAAFDALLNTVLPRLATQPAIVPGKTSAVEAMLEQHRDAVMALLDRGYAPGTIARMIADADESDAGFAAETIRLGIVRLRDRAERERPKSAERSSNARATRKAPPKHSSPPPPAQPPSSSGSAFANATRRP